MPTKYKKPENKNKRRTHNRPYYGPWYCMSKELAKKHRKYMKMLRHKLLFHIPLDEHEQKVVDMYKLTSDTGLDSQGFPNRKYDWNTNEYIPKSGKTERWRFMDPKEERRNEIK